MCARARIRASTHVYIYKFDRFFFAYEINVTRASQEVDTWPFSACARVLGGDYWGILRGLRGDYCCEKCGKPASYGVAMVEN